LNRLIGDSTGAVPLDTDGRFLILPEERRPNVGLRTFAFLV
jgi:hypothetical protein